MGNFFSAVGSPRGRGLDRPCSSKTTASLPEMIGKATDAVRSGPTTELPKRPVADLYRAIDAPGALLLPTEVRPSRDKPGGV